MTVTLSPLEQAYILAVEQGNLDGVWKALHEGVDIHVSPHAGETMLHTALRNGDSRIAQLLLGYGLDANRGSLPALHVAILRKDVASARMLLAHGADCSRKDKSGKAALHMAAATGQPEMTRLLLDYGADIGQQGESQFGPATAEEMAQDALDDRLQTGDFSTTVALLRQQREEEEMTFPETWDRALLTFEMEGYTALMDQPRFWHQFADVAQAMRAQGLPPLRKAELLATNAAGRQWLLRAVECGAFGEVMAHLAGQGEYLTPKDLLSATGDANPLLEAIVAHHALPDLFTLKQWQEQGHHALMRVYRALEPEARSQVMNYNALFTLVQLSQAESAREIA